MVLCSLDVEPLTVPDLFQVSHLSSPYRGTWAGYQSNTLHKPTKSSLSSQLQPNN